jgi:hypothetical protein
MFEVLLAAGGEVILVFFVREVGGEGREGSLFNKVDMLHIILANSITFAISLNGDKALHHFLIALKCL